MLLETKAIIQFALLWGSTWIVASLAIASVLTMALVATFIVSRVEIRRQGVVAAVLVGLLLLNALVPVGRGRDREPCPGVAVLRGADVQPDPLRRPAVRLGHQAFDVAGARLRHQPARGDGRRCRGIPVAGDRLPLAPLVVAVFYIAAVLTRRQPPHLPLRVKMSRFTGTRESGGPRRIPGTGLWSDATEGHAMGDITRRKFVKTVAGTGAAVTIVPRHVLGAASRRPATP